MWEVKMETVEGYNRAYFKFETLQSAVNFIEEATAHCTCGLDFRISKVEEGEEDA